MNFLIKLQDAGHQSILIPQRSLLIPIPKAYSSAVFHVYRLSKNPPIRKTKRWDVFMTELLLEIEILDGDEIIHYARKFR